MPLKTLVVIALRLYTIYWLVQGIAQCVVLIPVFMGFASHGISPPDYVYFVSLLWIFFVAGVLWFSAFRLSSQVTKGHDTELVFTSLTKGDLYRFAFVFLGVFFALSSIFSVLQTGYQFFAFDFPQPANNPEKGRYLWPFLGHAFTMIAGFACVFGARKWTNKLIRLENKHEAPSPVV
jgi:hypothetical protein